jgi:arylsulfatase A-like enzyme
MDQFVRGFEYYVNATRSAKPIHHHLVGGDLNARLLPWLKAHAEESFFLFVHYWDPHTPYNQPDDYRELFSHVPGHLDDLEVKRAPAGYDYVPGWGNADEICEIWESAPEGREWTIDLYDGEIRYVDELVGQVTGTLESLGLLEDTVIIITSDHGEQLGQHGMWGHGMLHEAVIYVPLIIWGPSVVPAGKVVSGYAQQVDIAPTILALLGADETKLPRFDGMNLLPVIEGQEPLRDKMFAETSASRAMLDGRWKYIRTYYLDQEELYDLQSDPMEVNNLASQEELVLEDMRGQLSAWIREGLGGQADPLWRQVATVAEAVDKVFGRQWRVPSVRSLRKGP